MFVFNFGVGLLEQSVKLTNARDVSFETLYGGQFTSSTQLIMPNYLVFPATN